MKNADYSAFPVTKDRFVNEENKFKNGLTKREYFAAMAMSGMMANNENNPSHPDHYLNIARTSIRIADELLKQLES